MSRRNSEENVEEATLLLLNVLLLLVYPSLQVAV